MTTPMTEAELAPLEAARTEEAWNQACDAVKEVRGGQWPSDWYAKVVQSGLAGRASALFMAQR